MRKNKYPNIGDITIVVPVRITDLGVYVKLLEYNDIEGLIILSDLSKSRFRSINKIVSIGKKFPASVTNVDKNTNNISLSKKEVSIDEANECENNFKTSKQIYDLVNLFVRKLDKLCPDSDPKMDIESAYMAFIWCISENPQILYQSLRNAVKDFDKIYGNKLDGIDPQIVKHFRDVLSIKFREKNILLEAILEITCEEHNGINIIKSALLKGQSLATNEYPFKIKLVKAPYYSITLNTISQEIAITTINTAIFTIKNELEINNANIKIIKLPQIVIDKEFEPDKSDSENEVDDEIDDEVDDEIDDE